MIEVIEVKPGETDQDSLWLGSYSCVVNFIIYPSGGKRWVMTTAPTYAEARRNALYLAAHTQDKPVIAAGVCAAVLGLDTGEIMTKLEPTDRAVISGASKSEALHHLKARRGLKINEAFVAYYTVKEGQYAAQTK